MAVNKIELATGDVLIDLTADSVTEEAVLDGVTFHGADGGAKTGAFTLRAEMTEQDSLIEQIKTALAGKAAGGVEDLEAILTEQEELIATLQETLRQKAAGGGTDTRFKELAECTLTEIDDDSITEITRQYAFAYSDSLVTVRLPNVTSSAQCAFRYCSSLESVDMPNLKGTLQTYFFQNCYKLKNVNIPLITTTSSSVFQGCEELETVRFGNITSVGANSFNGCVKLTALIVERVGTKAPNMSATGVLTGTPIEGGTGYIYVPASMVDLYKSATNWSTYAAQIRAIEDYPEICGG